MAESTKLPSTRTQAEILIDRPGLRAIRYQLRAGEALPAHHAPKDVVLVVLAGRGSVSIDERVVPVQAGSVIGLEGERHGVVAEQALSFLIVQATLDARRAPAALLVPPPVEVGSARDVR